MLHPVCLYTFQLAQAHSLLVRSRMQGCSNCLANSFSPTGAVAREWALIVTIIVTYYSLT